MPVFSLIDLTARFLIRNQHLIMWHVIPQELCEELINLRRNSKYIIGRTEYLHVLIKLAATVKEKFAEHKYDEARPIARTFVSILGKYIWAFEKDFRSKTDSTLINGIQNMMIKCDIHRPMLYWKLQRIRDREYRPTMIFNIGGRSIFEETSA